MGKKSFKNDLESRMPATCDVDMNTRLVKRCELQVRLGPESCLVVQSCGGGEAERESQ